MKPSILEIILMIIIIPPFLYLIYDKIIKPLINYLINNYNNNTGSYVQSAGKRQRKK